MLFSRLHDKVEVYSIKQMQNTMYPQVLTMEPLQNLYSNEVNSPKIVSMMLFTSFLAFSVA